MLLATEINHCCIKGMDGGFSVQGYFLMILWSLGLECLVALLSVFSHLLFSFFFLEIRELIKFFLSNYMLLKIFFPIVIMFIFFLLLLLIFFTGSAGTIFILKKIQNGVVLVKNKNKSQRVATGFLTGILPGQPAGSAGS